MLTCIRITCTPLVNCFLFVLFLAMIGTILNIFVPEVNYYGLWGIPHIPFALIVSVVFYIGTKLDPRLPPKEDVNQKLTLRSLRILVCLSQTSSLFTLNIILFLEGQGILFTVTKIFTTIAVILRTQVILSDMIDREFEDVFSKKLEIK